jgi:hypothetical protein
MSSTESQLPRLIAAKFAGQRGYQFTEWAKEFLDAAEERVMKMLAGLTATSDKTPRLV